MRLRKRLVAALMVVTAVSFLAYAWAARDGSLQAEIDEQEHSDVTSFEAVINGMRSEDVFVCVDLNDGLTEKEAELIVGTTFILVMGEYVTHRLDALTFDDTQIEAHYTWGHDEADMGHIFEITADLTTLQITVNHCF